MSEYSITRLKYLVSDRMVTLVVTGLLILSSHSTLANPQRIVSINLCTDQLLMLLAKRENIESVSYFAANPDASAMFEEAAGIRKNQGQAEEILQMKPDLILAGTFTARPAV
ncbi:MAG: hypothetical protein ABGX32_02600, partial [Methylococcales bacterium]